MTSPTTSATRHTNAVAGPTTFAEAGTEVETAEGQWSTNGGLLHAAAANVTVAKTIIWLQLGLLPMTSY